MAHTRRSGQRPRAASIVARYRRGVVREIVDHQHAAEFSLHIHSTLHAAKCFQSLGDLSGSDVPSLGDHHGRQRVQNVMPTSSGQRELAKINAAMRDAKSNGFFVDRQVAGDPIVALGKAVGLDLAEALFRPRGATRGLNRWCRPR